jgi:hypothetical protein
MTYRTKTYIAAEWDGDENAVKQLHKWNKSKKWSLSFTDAHQVTQARDSSLNCSIKASLATRFDVSKTFILIVGQDTKTVRSGSCQYCKDYNSANHSCYRGYSTSLDSYIDYECQKAVRDGLKIIVLYKATTVNKSKCPDSIKDIGVHVAMLKKKDDGKNDWDYQAVKNAIS